MIYERRNRSAVGLTRGSARAAAASALAGLLAGCAGAVTFEPVTGGCAEERTRCHAECGGLKDPLDCEVACDFDARTCERRPGNHASAFDVGSPLRTGPRQALLVDLFTPRIRSSSALTVRPVGDVSPIDGAHVFSPGASLQIDVVLPPNLREAELVLIHGPGADVDTNGPCLITVTAGDKTLVGRYSPPRAVNGVLRRESWILTPHLPEVAADQPTQLKIVVFNNDVAGSNAGYQLAGLELLYTIRARR